jgi:hypothetical protein
MRYLLTLASALLISGTILAQNLTRTNVVKVNLRSTGAIIQNNQVKGYFYFIRVDKKDRQNNHYLLSIYDENLREIHTVDIIRPSSYFLIDGVFNGTAFGFLFYDTRGKQTELLTYDQTLQQLGNKKQPVTNKMQVAMYTQYYNGAEPQQELLTGVDNVGFIYYGLQPGKKLHHDVQCYSNDLTLMWNHKANDKTTLAVEMASEGFQSENYVGTLIQKKKSLQSKDIDTELVVQEISTGKTLFRTPMATSRYSVSFADVHFDSEKQEFVVFGEYYNLSDRELKAESLGFICLTLDITGKIISEKTNSWANEMSKATPLNERGKFEGGNFRVVFHDIIRTADGKIFVVGEQYKKVASAAGIISNVLVASMGGGVQSSNAQLNIYNMVIFEFNPDYSIKRVHIFEKDKNVVALPAGSEYTSSKMLSYYSKAVGGFDFAFTQMSSDGKTFYVSYVNWDREKGEKSRNVLGTIVYTPEQTFTVDKLPMARKSTSYYVHRAKEGYVLITEYSRKEKRLDSRLEKVNY